MTAQPPRRVRVTSPRRDAARRRPARAATHEIDEQTGIGLLYLSTLVRTQRRLATGLLGGLLVLLVGLPVGVRLLPRPAASDTGWIVATWVSIGVLAYPLMWAAAQWFDHASARLEDQFAAAATGLAGGSPPQDPDDPAGPAETRPGAGSTRVTGAGPGAPAGGSPAR